MLAVYVSFTHFCADKGAAKIARQLGFDYAEAVVSALTSQYIVI